MRFIFIVTLIILYSCKFKEKNKSTEEEYQSTVNESILLKKNRTDTVKKKNVGIISPETEKDSAYYLKNFYNDFVNQKDSLSEYSFFNKFPNSFEQFNSLYGYDDVLGGRPLYNEGYDHILGYSKLREHIANVDYYNKLIDISIGGHWEADNISYLQEVLNITFHKNPRLFSELINKRSENEKKSFWVFFFDGPHPGDPETNHIYNEVLSSLDSLNKEMIPIVKSAYAKVEEDWKKH